MTIQQKLKDLFFKKHYNDLFDDIRKELNRKKSDSLNLSFYKLYNDWNSQNNNFNEDEWKQQMLEFIKKLSGDAVDANDWYFLDRNELKKRFKQVVRENKVIAFVFEDDDEALSIESHNILRRFYASRKKGSFKESGNTNDWELDLSDSIANLELDWLEIISTALNTSAENIDDACTNFTENNNNQSYFIIQQLSKFNFEKFQQYLNFWQRLKPREPIFLMFHVLDDTIQSREWNNFSQNEISCNFEYAGTYELVTGRAFKTFFARSECSYLTNDRLYHIEPIPLKKAKEILEQ